MSIFNFIDLRYNRNDDNFNEYCDECDYKGVCVIILVGVNLVGKVRRVRYSSRDSVGVNY